MYYLDEETSNHAAFEGIEPASVISVHRSLQRCFWDFCGGSVPWLCLGGAGTLGCWGQLGFRRWGQGCCDGIGGLVTAVHGWLQIPGGQLDLSPALAGWPTRPGSGKLDWSCKLMDNEAANSPTRTSSILMRPFQGDGQMEEARQGGVGC